MNPLSIRVLLRSNERTMPVLRGIEISSKLFSVGVALVAFLGVQPGSLNAADGDYYRQLDLEIGEKKIVNYLISLDAGNGDPILSPTADYDDQDQTFQQIDAKLRESSYGQAWFVWDIYPPKGEDPLVLDASAYVNLNGNIGTNGDAQHTLTFSARTIARQRWGSDIESGIRHRYGLFPSGPDGSAYVGGTQAAGRSSDRGVLWHELIHNLGFHHGSDPTTPITTSGGGNYSSGMRAFNGWLRENEGFHRITQTGTYRIYDLDQPELITGKQFAAVIERRDPSTGALQVADLWLEFRPQWADRKVSGAFHPNFANGLRLVNFGLRAGIAVDPKPDDGTNISFVLPSEAWTDTGDTHTPGNSYIGSGAVITVLSVNDTTPKSIDVHVELPETDFDPTAVATFKSVGAAGYSTLFDGSDSFDIDGTIGSYLWEFGDGMTSTDEVADHIYSTAGSYSVSLTVTDDDGNTHTAFSNITIQSAAAPTITYQYDGSTGLYYPGDYIYLFVNYTGVPEPSFQWYKDSQPIEGATKATYLKSETNFDDDGTYYVTLTNELGSVSSNPVQVIFTTNTKPVAVLTADVTTGESEVTVNFDASGSLDADGDELIYEWDFGPGGFVAGSVTQSRTFTKIGNNWVSLRVFDGMSYSPIQYINVIVTEPVPPTAVLTSDVTTGDAPFAVSFDASQSSDDDGLALNYLWDFDDGNGFVSGSAIEPKVFIMPGAYTVQMKVDNGEQESNVEVIDILVENPNLVETVIASDDFSTGYLGGTGWADDQWDGGSSFTAQSSWADVTNGGLQFSESPKYIERDVVLPAADGSTLYFDRKWAAGRARSYTFTVNVIQADSTETEVYSESDNFDINFSTVQADLSAFTGEAITIAFRMTTRSGNTKYRIDNVQIVTRNVDTNAPNIAPVAAFTADKLTGEAPLEVNFDASASGDTDSDPISYSWDFSNGSGFVSGGVMNSYTFAEEGIYTVKLRVNDGKDDSEIATKTITVTGPAGPIVGSAAFNEWAETAMPGATLERKHPDYKPYPVNGLSNLEYYAFGIEIPSEQTGNPVFKELVDVSGRRLRIIFPRDERRDDLTYEVQASDDLIRWDVIARSTSGAATANHESGSHVVNESGDGVVKTVTIEDSENTTSKSNRFLRLVIYFTE